MPDPRPILLVIGVFLTVLGVGMLLPMVADLIFGHDDWQVFAVSSFVTLFAGLALFLANMGYSRDLTLQQAFLLTSVSWVVVVAFAAIPFAISELNLSYTDAYFEAMSGITTTGSTVIAGLDTAPPGILLWRAILQWLGGLGIIVMAVAILPMLKVGGMQLFKAEAFDQPEKVLPSAAAFAVAITGIYAAVTFIWFALYWAAGMMPFDAFAHAMTTIATGGFSTKDASLGHFSPLIQYVAIGGMIAGSLPFALYLRGVQGAPGALFRDEQVRGFLLMAGVAVALMMLAVTAAEVLSGEEAIRHAAFNTISIFTGTGYATTDYSVWGGFAIVIFFVIMFIGGCAGSTSCGIKVFRFQIAYKASIVQIKRLVHPRGVFVMHYNGQRVSEEVVSAVVSFFFFFFLAFIAGAIILSLMGLDGLTAMSAAATAMANVGPGLGDVVGPAGTFAPLPDAAKWLLSGLMLLGRLELFTVLILFTPAFWRA